MDVVQVILIFACLVIQRFFQHIVVRGIGTNLICVSVGVIWAASVGTFCFLGFVKSHLQASHLHCLHTSIVCASTIYGIVFFFSLTNFAAGCRNHNSCILLFLSKLRFHYLFPFTGPPIMLVPLSACALEAVPFGFLGCTIFG